MDETGEFENVCTSIVPVLIVIVDVFGNVCRTIATVSILLPFVSYCHCVSCMFLVIQTQIEIEEINQRKHSAHLYFRPSGF
jgi:Na+/alanine symporter